MTKNLILTRSRMMVARFQRTMAVLKGHSVRGTGYKFWGAIVDRIHELNIYKRMDRKTCQRLFSLFMLSTPRLKVEDAGRFPRREDAERFSRRCQVHSLARREDGECFPRQVGVSKFDSFIFSKQTSPNKSKGRMK